MPAPTTYSEASLAAFLLVELGDIGSVLGWTAVGHAQIVQAVTDTERLLGVTDVATAPDAVAVERLGALAVWRRAWGALVARYQVAEDQQSYSRQQMFDMARQKLADVERAAMPYLAEYQIRRDTLTAPSGDPYRYAPDELRVL